MLCRDVSLPGGSCLGLLPSYLDQIPVQWGKGKWEGRLHTEGPTNLCGFARERRSFPTWKGHGSHTLTWPSVSKHVPYWQTWFQPHGDPVGKGAGLEGAERSAAVSFTASFCFPLITEELKTCSASACYFWTTFPNKHSGAKPYPIVILNLCIFLKSVLCAHWEFCFWTFFFCTLWVIFPSFLYLTIFSHCHSDCLCQATSNWTQIAYQAGPLLEFVLHQAGGVKQIVLFIFETIIVPFWHRDDIVTCLIQKSSHQTIPVSLILNLPSGSDSVSSQWLHTWILTEQLNELQ